MPVFTNMAAPYSKSWTISKKRSCSPIKPMVLSDDNQHLPEHAFRGRHPVGGLHQAGLAVYISSKA
jgi:hypothetical protein